MGDVRAVNMDTITDRSSHAATGMAVSVCITPGVVAGAPGPVAYPALTSTVLASQAKAMAKKLSTATAPQLKTQLNTLHAQMISPVPMDPVRWVKLINEYAQTASAFYSRLPRP